MSMFSNARAQSMKLYNGIRSGEVTKAIKESNIAQTIKDSNIAKAIANSEAVKSVGDNLIHKGLREEAEDKIIQKSMVRNAKDYKGAYSIIEDSYKQSNKNIPPESMKTNRDNIRDYLNSTDLDIAVGSVKGEASGHSMFKRSIGDAVGMEGGMSRNTLPQEEISRLIKEKSDILHGEVAMKTPLTMAQQYYSVPINNFKNAKTYDDKHKAVVMGAYRYGATAGVLAAGNSLVNNDNTSRL